MKRWPQPPTATHNHQKTTQVAPMSTNLSDRDCTNTMENSAKEHKKSLAYLWLITIYSLWQSILRSLWKGPFQLLGHQWQQVRQTFYFSSQGLWHSNLIVEINIKKVWVGNCQSCQITIVSFEYSMPNGHYLFNLTTGVSNQINKNIWV